MVLAVVALLALGATAGDPLSSYLKQPIYKIEVDAPAGENQENLLELLDLQPGYLLTTDDLQAAQKRLYSLGRFSLVEVFATRVSGSVALRFRLESIQRLGELEIDGLRLADASALSDSIRFRRGSEIDSRTAEVITKRAIEYLKTAGFPHARATFQLDDEYLSGEPRNATLIIDEGIPTRIQSLRFVGDVRVADGILSREIKSDRGAILDRSVLEADQKRLVELYRKRGFLQAEVSPARVMLKPDSAVVEFVVRAGPRIAFQIVGNRTYTRKELMRFAPGIDAPLTDRDVDDFADRIQEAYTRIGRFTTKVATRRVLAPSSGVVTYQLGISEGPPMEVVDIAVTGSIAIEGETIAEVIRAELRQQVGDVGILDRLATTDRCLLQTSPTNNRDQCPPREITPERRWVPGVYSTALESVAASYQNLGYLRVKVGPPEITLSGQTVRVHIPVEEGMQTFIRTLSYRGNQEFSASTLLQKTYESTAGRPAQAPIQPGAPFSRNGVEDARIGMIRSYRDGGFLYARVFSDLEFSDDGQWVDVVYRFDEGPRVRINRVLVRGNRFTKESVILSRITLQSGDIYRLEQALSDQRLISELGVFDSVRVRLIDEERPSELKDLVAEVVERNRQPIEFAPGISTAEGPRVQASYSHINLFGTAFQLSVIAKINRQVFFGLYGQFADGLRNRYDEFSTIDQIERVLQVGLRSPRYVNLFWEPTIRTEVIHERSITLSYAFNSTRFVTGVDLQPLKRLRLSIAPEVSITNLTCADVELGDFNCLGTAQGNNPALFSLSQGERRAIRIGPAIVYDARDNPFFPSAGFLVSASADYSIGRSRESNTDGFDPQAFLRGELSLSRYFALGNTVLALAARGGHIRPLQNDIPIYERFFLGGRTTLRGFPERTLIAEDCQIVDARTASTTNQECSIVVNFRDAPITQGGKNYLLLKGELRIPIGGAASVGLFVDSGNLWFDRPTRENFTLRVSSGAGLRINTPVGPLALDFGINTNRRPLNGESRWSPHFTVGVF